MLCIVLPCKTVQPTMKHITSIEPLYQHFICNLNDINVGPFRPLEETYNNIKINSRNKIFTLSYIQVNNTLYCKCGISPITPFFTHRRPPNNSSFHTLTSPKPSSSNKFPLNHTAPTYRWNP